MPLLFSRGQRLHPWSVLFGYPPQVPTHEWDELSPERQGRLLGAEGFQVRLS